jgi:hypothetical protein
MVNFFLKFSKIPLLELAAFSLLLPGEENSSPKKKKKKNNPGPTRSCPERNWWGMAPPSK